uniref:Ubiquitin-conjugating enzyme E2 Z n=1 Tax=Calcidiscus leptoporus TaxID=127549 RepID=A0A7S0J7D7_9EUKA|mmetsp:Transcript_41494/g.97073  ORF Transcript_41494/g.97073 Transcript_41494/m.97073 type:complete len:434 (+) Transcript_41494:110-1411(+)|eukprot:CAMPEP_0119355486 /NCGR_PEP_ID=MMETSP1334-20130426/4307_1 /TAXON_ID=127549 /ORGANISM="Calcidiscus leptoporus, Strain RCC1130" /LENGTH=433 /DNA_ID=CAMNT_0007369319 /DNA_START=109 /DNA_END=1410 /DNA_ORIENTATION=-
MSAASRLMREERDISMQTTPVIFAQPDESDIYHWLGLILGPPGTPYCLGLFHFDLKFPSDYPNSPPKVLITTTGGGHVRFNPNLYSTGKVCLSILGTWRAEHSGEQWSAVQSVTSVLLSIQSLLHDKPYHNEPSFEQDDGSGDIQRYNDKILHETVRVAVCDVMEDTIQNRATSSNGVSPIFQHTRRQLFLMYHERYLHEVQRMSERNDIRDGTQFKKMPFECANNGMSGSFQWTKLRTRLGKLHATLMSEIDDWRRQGAEQTSLLKAHHDAAVNSCIHYLRQQEDRIRHEMPEGASIGADETNACVWVATIFGPSETLWDGGMFQVEFIFPPDFPEAPPFVHFLTSMFHPHINSQGVPYLRTLVIWKHADPKEKTISALVGQLISLLTVEPSPEPATHLNNTAADLHFSRSDDERKEYKRHVKRCVQRSMDM